MFGKLMKHELKALFRILLIVGVVALVISGVGSLLVYTDPEGFLGMLLVLVGIYFSLAVAIMALAWSVKQFYSSMFTGEGYMTHSLPITPMQMVWAKLLSALIAMFFGVLICIASISMMLSSFLVILDPVALEEFWAMFGQLGDMFQQLIASEPLAVVEMVILLIVSIPMTMLFFYTVICVGQLFTKGRKWITYAIGIGLIFVVLPILSNYCLNPILEAASNASIHLSLWINIIVDVGLEVGMLFLIRYIMLHRVNLIV